MKLIFDTHAFLWWATDPDQLSPAVRSACADHTTTLLVSVVSAWELQIKTQLGKIRFTSSLEHLFVTQQRDGVQLLPITLTHILYLDQLPLHHKDPFDRLILAQAHVEEAHLVSKDHVFQAYPVKLFW